MKKLEPKKKALFITEITILALFLALFLVCLIVQLAVPESAFSIWVKENVWDINKTLISLKSHVPTLIQSVIYIVIVYAVCRIVRLIFNARMKNSLRAKTVFSLLDGFVKYACAYEVADAMKFAAANRGFISLHIRRILHSEATSYCVSNTSFITNPRR